MRLATIRNESGVEQLCFGLGDRFTPVNGARSGTHFSHDLQGVLQNGELPRLVDFLNGLTSHQRARLSHGPHSLSDARFGPLYRRPRKIWGIGLNYADHARDLSESPPTGEPASFMKPDTAIIGPGDPVRLPIMSNRVTGEAELAIIIGTECRNVPREDWLSVVGGFTTVVDMTAEDILRRNPR
ncbi:MAG: fumarylacetoacetate hydrolase family protein, partial [Rhodothermales bacterium]|nr:fumarylacetoacetate hydrolase family protein [Rhodothermales bacterium]